MVPAGFSVSDVEFSAENSQLGAGAECAAVPEAFPGTGTPEQLSSSPRTRQPGAGSLGTLSIGEEYALRLDNGRRRASIRPIGRRSRKDSG